MSRIGRKPVPIPSGVEVEIEKGNKITVKGPKGELVQTFHPEMKIEVKDGQVVVSRPSDAKFFKALHGLTRTLIANMITGVTQGYQKELEIVGIGYRAQKVGNKLILQVGYTHPVEVSPPPGINIAVEGGTKIIVSGIDKQKVGQVAADIRAICPPNPYTGKGIRYKDEQVRLKPGKKAVGRK